MKLFRNNRVATLMQTHKQWSVSNAERVMVMRYT